MTEAMTRTLDGAVHASDTGAARPRVVMLTEVDFWNPGAGHRTRMLALARFLSRHTHLSVVLPMALDAAQQARGAQALPGCTLHGMGLPASVRMGDALAALQAWFAAAPRQDACIVEYLSLGWLRASVPAGVRTFVDTHDVASQRDADFARFGYRVQWQTMDERQERARLAQFDSAIAISRPDAQVFADWLGPARVVLAPHALVPCPQPLRAQAQRVLFVGSSYAPNVDALRWFLQAVWPAFAAQGRVLEVVGGVGGLLAGRTVPGVQVRGPVDDLEGSYAAADICINPVRFGSGIKIKTLEALAHGRPLVTTPAGMRGLEHAAGQAFLVAEDATGFARALQVLLDAPERRAALARAGLQLVAEEYSEQACYGALLARLA